MPFDPRKWRAGVRAAFENGEANPFGSGPWLPGGWYTPSWYIWKKGGMRLEITESRTSTEAEASGPEHGSGPLVGHQDVTTETYHFIAEISEADLYRGLISEVPEGASYWCHESRCAYGPGLYHCAGGIALTGTLTYTRSFTRTFIPSEGDPPDPDYYETESEYTITIDYSTDPAELNGRATPCRIMVDQFLGPLGAAWFDATLWFPQPTDPDGVVGTPEHPVAEKYYTDTALAALASSWGSSMVLGGGSLSAAQGPNEDGIDNGGYKSHVYSRSGILTLAAL